MHVCSSEGFEDEEDFKMSQGSHSEECDWKVVTVTFIFVGMLNKEYLARKESLEDYVTIYKNIVN